MNNGGHNTNSKHVGGGAALPSSVGEDVVLAWVDGELDGAEQARLAGEHPGLAALVRGMRDDARRIAALPLDRAPADMPARVTAVLEREALLGMERSAPGEGDLPAMHISRSRRVPAWVPRMAMAAGFVLLVGGAAWLARIAYQSLPSRPPLGPVAVLDMPKPGLTTGASGVSEATVLAQGEPEREDAANTMVRADHGAAPAGASIAANAEADATSLAAALELAREERLLIRVRSRDGVRDRFAGTSTRAWRVVGDAPAGVAVALATPRDADVPNAEQARPHALADDNGGTPEPLVDLRAAKALLRSTASARALTLELAPSETALGGVLAALQASASRGAEVSFEALPPGVTLGDLGVVRLQEAQELLWWTRPVDSWSSRVLVPVVIEGD